MRKKKKSIGLQILKSQRGGFETFHCRREKSASRERKRWYLFTVWISKLLSFFIHGLIKLLIQNPHPSFVVSAFISSHLQLNKPNDSKSVLNSYKTYCLLPTYWTRNDPSRSIFQTRAFPLLLLFWWQQQNGINIVSCHLCFLHSCFLLSSFFLSFATGLALFIYLFVWTFFSYFSHHQISETIILWQNLEKFKKSEILKPNPTKPISIFHKRYIRLWCSWIYAFLVFSYLQTFSFKMKHNKIVKEDNQLIKLRVRVIIF